MKTMEAIYQEESKRVGSGDTGLFCGMIPKTQNRITLYRSNAGWMALHSDPAIMVLFGTDAIPTAFTKLAQKSVVLREIKKLNPDADVEAMGPEEIGGEIAAADRFKMSKYI